MVRKIIHIDEEKCTGCGLCANACHEGAIDIVNGKAKLVREHFCDGFGDCLPSCPTGAITFEEREAPEYDEAAVEAAKTEKKAKSAVQTVPVLHACPGSAMRNINAGTAATALRNWPVEIKLAPVQAPYFDGAQLLISADCCAYTCATFHRDYMAGRVTLIGCPKLDSVDYSEKLTAILRNNDIAGVTVTRMQVPCCGGLEMAVRRAIEASGKRITLQVVTLTLEGEVLRREVC